MPKINSHSHEEPTYFGDVMGDYNNGCRLDVRSKLAVDFLKASGCVPVYGQDPTDGAQAVLLTAKERVAYALDLAGEVIAQSYERGWAKDLSESDELTQAQRRHIRHSIRTQVYGQLQGQAIAQEEQKGTIERPPLLV